MRATKSNLVAFAAGLIFALGLGLGGMTNPAKVIAFLDLFGHWDPTLVFVMIGAIGVHSISYRFITLRPTPLLSSHWHIPTQRDLTPRLIAGSAIFGIGWGLAGYCPGPAVTSLVNLQVAPWLIVLGMAIGMTAFRFLDRAPQRTSPKPNVASPESDFAQAVLKSKPVEVAILTPVNPPNRVNPPTEVDSSL